MSYFIMLVNDLDLEAEAKWQVNTVLSVPPDCPDAGTGQAGAEITILGLVWNRLPRK